MEALDQRLARRFVSEHPHDAARLLERLPPDEAAAALARVVEVAPAVLEQMDRDASAACLLNFPREQRTALVASLRADLAARLLRLLGPSDREAILAACADPVARPLRRLLRFSEDTAGALMDPLPLSAPRDMAVTEVRRRLERNADGVLYIVERSEALAGLVTIAALLRAPADALLEQLMKTAVPRIGARVEREAILAHPGWQDHHQLPVVDRGDVLVGVLRYRTMRQLQGQLAAPPPSTSLGLALGEMYWTMMSTLVEGASRALSPRPPAGEKPR